MAKSKERNPFEFEMDELLAQLSVLGSEATPIQRWLTDQQIASVVLGDHQARFLVDAYYMIQENRKRLANQSRALRESQEPNFVIEWLLAQDKRLESWIQWALLRYVTTHKMGSWMMGIYGIGPVLSAGLIANIDINRAPTVGHIWQFCGIAGDGQKPWLKGTKRPYSEPAKTLCWKIGDSFIKFSNSPDCYYGRLYRERKAIEIANNDSGKLVAQATYEAENKCKDKTSTKYLWNSGCYPAGTCALVMSLEIDKREAYLKLVAGKPGSGLPMLHIGHINDRARRWAVKQFLADLHGEWYQREFNKKPPFPYPIQILGHTHLRVPPEWGS